MGNCVERNQNGGSGIRAVFALPALAQQSPSPADIDPNTKTEGGADVRESGADAGEKIDLKKEKPDRKEKPIAERKPGEREQEREKEEAAKGESAKPQ